MFTGIIEKTGKIIALRSGPSSLKVEVETGFQDLALGESVAINGVCLTVEAFSSAKNPIFDVSEETRRRTQLARLTELSVVNLERALTLQTRLSGHWVQGHVDGVGEFLSAIPEGTGYRADFRVPAELSRYCVEKGSIAIQGISLTIGAIEDLPSGRGTQVSVFLVPFTWNHTGLSLLHPKETVNLEVDILAKYAERLLLKR